MKSNTIGVYSIATPATISGKKDHFQSGIKKYCINTKTYDYGLLF
ncbi:MAG TPA: hypothetical protein VFI70_12590 [Nitrososphaeraceae archaeon]|nr:hypothetical protein [Nitrososphaeraceae archaeon]